MNLYCEVDFKVCIMLGRPFLATGRALVSMEKGQRKFKLNHKKVTFNVCQSVHYPKDMRVVSIIDSIKEDRVILPIKERFRVEALGVVIMNFQSDGFDEYYDMVSTLYGRSSYNYSPDE